MLEEFVGNPSFAAFCIITMDSHEHFQSRYAGFLWCALIGVCKKGLLYQTYCAGLAIKLCGNVWWGIECISPQNNVAFWHIQGTTERLIASSVEVTSLLQLVRSATTAIQMVEAVIQMMMTTIIDVILWIVNWHLIIYLFRMHTVMCHAAN